MGHVIPPLVSTTSIRMVWPLVNRKVRNRHLRFPAYFQQIVSLVPGELHGHSPIHSYRLKFWVASIIGAVPGGIVYRFMGNNGE